MYYIDVQNIEITYLRLTAIYQSDTNLYDILVLKDLVFYESLIFFL